MQFAPKSTKLEDFQRLDLSKSTNETSCHLIHYGTDFINGTHLCKQFGKKFSVWCNSDTCQALIESWKMCYKTENCFIHYVNGSKPDANARKQRCRADWYNDEKTLYSVQGTYVHYFFIPALMQWLDPSLIIQTQYSINQNLKAIRHFTRNGYTSSSASDSDDDDHVNRYSKGRRIFSMFSKQFEQVSLKREGNEETSRYLLVHIYTNFVNGTHLCKQYDKDFGDWRSSDTCQQLMRSWDRCYRRKVCFMCYGTQFEVARLEESPTGNGQIVADGAQDDFLDDNPVRGTYVHHYFLPALMAWVDPTLVSAAQHAFGHRYKMINHCDSSSSCSSSDSSDDEGTKFRRMLFTQYSRHTGYCRISHGGVRL